MGSLGRAAALGVLSGARAFAIPALLSRRLAESDTGGFGPVSSTLSAPGVARALAAGAALELIADKLPFMPNRTEPRGVLTRMAGGAVVGAATAELAGARPFLPALIGGAAAFVGTHIGYHARRWIRRKGDLPDPAVAVGEDAVVLAAAGGLVAEALEASFELQALEYA